MSSYLLSSTVSIEAGGSEAHTNHAVAFGIQIPSVDASDPRVLGSSNMLLRLLR